MAAGIYLLIDPRTLEPRYVGQAQDLDNRPEHHRNPGKRSGEISRAWLEELDREGLQYLWIVLEVVERPLEWVEQQTCWWWTGKNPSRLADAERYYIALFFSMGCTLCNMTWGDGALNPHPRTRARMSAAAQARWKDHMPEHGTRSRYSYYGCRCDLCKQAQREQHEQWKKSASAEHGTLKNYNLGCRCAACVEARKIARRAPKKTRTPQHGKSGYERGCRCEACSEALLGPKRKGLVLEPCGTNAAWARNTKLASQGQGCGPCADCIEAHRQYKLKPHIHPTPKCGCAECKEARKDEHGTSASFKRGCRCEICRNVNRNARRKRGGYGPRALKPCGTHSSYVRNLRYAKLGKPSCGPCEACCKAYSNYNKS